MDSTHLSGKDLKSGVLCCVLAGNFSVLFFKSPNPSFVGEYISHGLVGLTPTLASQNYGHLARSNQNISF